MAIKSSTFHYRRGSDASEKDFFDIADESIAQIAKRQLRRPRTWITLLVLFLMVKLYRSRPPPETSLLPHINYNKVDWSRYAYTQYATSETYLCNCLMVFEALDRFGSKADRILFYPQEWDLIIENDGDRTSQLLVMAKEEYNVQMRPIFIDGVRPPEDRGPAQASWDTSTAKLSAFALLEYERVIHLDSDMTLLQHMDDLFFLPKAPVAMPRAYWLLPETKTLSSLIAVIEPSYLEYTILRDASKPAVYGQIDVNLTDGRFDMELLNSRFGDNAMVLPHRQYGLVSGEFRLKDHWRYMGNAQEEWNPDKVLSDAKFVHFSDWPLPKPWTMWQPSQLAEMQPACDNNPGTPEESGCRDREVWKGLYDDFRRRRKAICKLLSFPAPP
ncbi:Glucose N-acetyltransferase 1 [Penicillium malachiteum]|uniref:Glucose N-acetyltransferase 1 n=1 Tax=Penicillium malachiteum TaxID=1324776 RepID=UPI002547BE22|nr:Glucose N-acetyltransferase 1 [Penicillium malachiteum]KAJ5715667.1 Glucose N-acetyltransferase 1 [Penicillium malachiteum]